MYVVNKLCPGIVCTCVNSEAPTDTENSAQQLVSQVWVVCICISEHMSSVHIQLLQTEVPT